MEENRLELFMNKKAENNEEMLVKAFISNENDVANPIYMLEEDGSINCRIFLATGYPQKHVEEAVKRSVPSAHFTLKAGNYYFSHETFAGYWVEFTEESEEST